MNLVLEILPELLVFGIPTLIVVLVIIFKDEIINKINKND